MMTTVPMELVSFLVFKAKAGQIATRLVSLGVFQPVDIRKIEAKLEDLSLFQISKETAEFDLLQSNILEVAKKLGLDLRGFWGSDIQDLSYPSTQDFLQGVDDQISVILSQRNSLKEELVSDEKKLSDARQHLPITARPETFDTFIFVSNGMMEEKNIAVIEKSLPGVPYVIYPFSKKRSTVYATFIGLRRDRELLAKVLSDVSWKEIEYPKEADLFSGPAREKLVRKIQDTKVEISGLEARIKDLAQLHKARLIDINSAIKVNKSLLEAKRFASTTEHTVLFSGWVPAQEREYFISQIKEVSGISYVESQNAESVDIPREEVPVQFKHSAFFKPFELLIEAYGIPRYGSIDPTVFVAISFLIMFGAMFGDTGHGLVLAFLGVLLANKSKNTALRRVKALLIYCGASSLVFGLLYGSFFGHEFSALWFKPIENILRSFKLSVFLGIALISLGIGINIVNAFRDKNYLKFFFDKSGLIGGVIYWAAVGMVIKNSLSPANIPYYYSFLLFSGILIIFLYPIIKCILEKKYSHLVESLMESIVQIMEIFMGYLANTVSFIRVAAFSLAHAGLFLAIFSLASIVRSSAHAGNISSALVFIFGNILVIVLEGMVVTIQTVRLNYYEFFSKFFISGKRFYRPLTIKGSF
jgi:V/A-type H+/Na+-transporting ATPase subunit I